MIERITVSPSREELVLTLQKIVDTVRSKHPEILGVILFGRRAHVDQPVPSSDVDLIIVQREFGHGVFALKDSLSKSLPQMNFDLDFCFIDIVEQALENPLSSLAVDCRKSVLRCLDRDCIFLVDPEIKEAIVKFTSCDQKRWSRSWR